MITDNRAVIKKQDYDIIVVGGGIAGVSAAVSATRDGAKVILMEKGIVLGGLATVGLISWYEPLCDGNGKKMIGGISEELIQLSVKYGFDDLAPIWKDGENKEVTHRRYSTHYSPTIFAMALDEYLLDNGVEILLDTQVIVPVMEGKVCKGVLAETKEGRVFYGAKAVVDATGDAQIMHNAGVPTVEGENFLSYVSHFTSYDLAKKYVDSENMAQFRKWKVCGSDLFGNGHPEGMKKFKGTSAEEITEFVLMGRKMMLEKMKLADKNSRDITMIATMPQFRTIRRIVGEYEFTGKEDGKTFENAVGSTGDFRMKGKHFQIPYTCLYNKQFDNLIAAGRIISASGDGWEVTRVIPVAALTGQAAGLAASMSIKTGNMHEVDIKTMQEKLKNSGVLLV